MHQYRSQSDALGFWLFQQSYDIYLFIYLIRNSHRAQNHFFYFPFPLCFLQLVLTGNQAAHLTHVEAVGQD